MERTNPTGPTTHRGGCHCGAVRFEVDVDLARAGARCNCTICTKVGATTSIVKPDAFRLLSPESEIAKYVWGGKIGARAFCPRCGVHCFMRGHVAELGGDFVSVALNCLDDVDPNALKVVHFDGRHNNWDAGPRDTAWPI